MDVPVSDFPTPLVTGRELVRGNHFHSTAIPYRVLTDGAADRIVQSLPREPKRPPWNPASFLSSPF
jgi:hypothetical protein